MNGTVRVTLDGVLSKDECESLLSLVQVSGEIRVYLERYKMEDWEGLDMA